MSNARILARGLPWLCGAAGAGLYLLTAQRQLYNDGVFFEDMLRRSGEALVYNHLLYPPLVKGLELAVSLVVPIDGEQAMKIASAAAGGIGIGLTLAIAQRALDSVHAAVACAVTLAMLAGYWFHATATELHAVHSAFAAALLLALVRIVKGERGAPTFALLGAGALLVPASHAGGICIGLPLACVFLRRETPKLRFAVVAGAGLAVFAAIYLGVLLQNAGFAGYTANLGGSHRVLFEDPGKVPTLLLGCAAEFGLYALPASTLLPAGLRVLFRSAPALGWLSLCWVLAWPLVAWPVQDRAIGSYFVPTYPVQVMLAVAALRGVGASAWRVAATVVLGVLPAVAYVASGSEAWALGALGACSLLVLALARAPGEAGHTLWLLPLAAAAISAPHVLSFKDLDPRRDRIAAVRHVVEAVDRETGKRSLLLFLAIDTSTNHHWKHFFPGAYGDETRAHNPLELAFETTPEKARRRRERFREILDEAVAAGRPVWLTGSMAEATELSRRHPCTEVDRYFAELHRDFAGEPAALPDLVRLRRRSP